jgi:hypothetical protein
MTMDPLYDRDDGDGAVTYGDGFGASPDDLELALPPEPRLRRCGAVHDVGTGPWIGTLVCCTRPIGHDGDHAISLGDPASPSNWRETWE